MPYLEKFDLSLNVFIRAKNDYENFCSIKIEATNKVALVNAFKAILEKDRTGDLREIMSNALMTVQKNPN